jgi:hypothetical protein
MTPDVVRYVQTLGYVEITLGIAFQTAILFLQCAAYRRHQRPSFLLLAISTSCGIVFLASSLAPRFYPTQIAVLYTCSFLLFCAQALLGLFGIITLFRDYRRLAEAAPATEPLSIHANTNDRNA